MVEPLNLMLKSREILTTPSLEGLELLLNQLYSRQETIEHQSALSLYTLCATKFPSCLSLKLLKLYQSSPNEVVRLKAIYLLSETLAAYRRNQALKFPLGGLNELKPHVISCLRMLETKESEMNILVRIMYFVAYDVFDNGGLWDELSECILSFTITEPLKAFQVFVDLPRVNGKFLKKFMHEVIVKAKRVLLNPELVRVDDWSLSLVTLVKMGIQLLDTGKRERSAKGILSTLVKAVKKLVDKEMEQFLLRGLEDLEKFLSRDEKQCPYNKDQCVFVSCFMSKARGFGAPLHEVARKINRLVKQSPIQKEHGGRFDYLSLLEILSTIVSSDLEEKSRDMAMRRLNLLLAGHTSKKVEIDVSVMRQLQPLLIACLSKEGISESMFEILGEVVYHVAYEMMNIRDETWFDLRDYIVSRSKTEFRRAVYIFQCLPMPLEDDEFLFPVVESLLQEINTRLSEVLEEWDMAFTGAFCLVMHLIDIPSQGKSVKEVAYKMIDSVREVVERGLEVELVRRAFSDLENIVKRHFELFGTSEYKFVKGMVWKLYEIKGMKMKSKNALWRINTILRGVAKEFKEMLKSELDWINQHDDQKSSYQHFTFDMTPSVIILFHNFSSFFGLVKTFLKEFFGGNKLAC